MCHNPIARLLNNIIPKVTSEEIYFWFVNMVNVISENVFASVNKVRMCNCFLVFFVHVFNKYLSSLNLPQALAINRRFDLFESSSV